MNRINMIIFYMLCIGLCAWSGTFSEDDRTVVQSIDTGITNTAISTLSEKVIVSAFGDPNTFYGLGNLLLFARLLKSNSMIHLPQISRNSLERALQWPGNEKNYPLLVTYRIILAFVKKDKEPDASFIHLHAAAKESLDALHDPDLSIALLELAKSWGDLHADTAITRLKSYLVNDLPLLYLIQSSWQNKADSEKRRMAQELESGFDKGLTTPSKVKIALCIGDIYYSLNQTRQWVPWYKKAIAHDTALRKDTPAGYRLEAGRRIVLCENRVVAIYIALFAVFCFLLFTFVRHRRAFIAIRLTRSV